MKSKKEFYNPSYFKDRDSLDPKIASVVSCLAKTKGLKKTLDVGCGTGRLVKYLGSKGFVSYGTDPYANIPKGKTFRKAYATDLPFSDNSFDLVTSISVIEHLKKGAALLFLREVKRVLKSQCYIFLVTPNYNSIWRIVLGKKWFGYSDPTHINFYTPAGLSKQLKKEGFRNVKFYFKTRGLSFIDYLLVSTPLWWIRDSFYISAQK